MSDTHTWVEVRTSAPVAYDWSDITVSHHEVEDGDLGTVRVVHCREDHVDEQVARYRSGLYGARIHGRVDPPAQSRLEKPGASDTTHVRVELLVDALRALGFACEDASYRNDCDPSVAVWQGAEISDSDEPVATVFVVDPDSECHDGPEGVGYFSPFPADLWYGSTCVSGTDVAAARGLEYAPSLLTLQEVAAYLRKLAPATVHEDLRPVTVKTAGPLQGRTVDSLRPKGEV